MRRFFLGALAAATIGAGCAARSGQLPPGQPTDAGCGALEGGCGALPRAAPVVPDEVASSPGEVVGPGRAPAAPAGAPGARQAPDVTRIPALLAAKSARTPAQLKVSSRLLDAGRAADGPVADGTAYSWLAGAGSGGALATVDIRADVTPAVTARIRALGGTVVSAVPHYRAVRARVPLAAVERLAGLDAVQAIHPAERARTRGQRSTPVPVVRRRDPGSAWTRAANRSEGDAAHRVAAARLAHGVDGTGIGIGVVSDGVDSLAARQASGDLPARITVLPGQAGRGDEGTAMLEIVHDLAPGAELYFAASSDVQAQFAANIEALCDAGADVIVDDIFFVREPVFQDGTIAQGVNAATDRGCFHVSAAGNDGNLNDGTSGVWEGDFVAGSPLAVNGQSVGVRHDFGGGVEANRIGVVPPHGFVLQWADPLGTSANDYDLFVVDGSGNVLASSTDTQDGAQDPIEVIERRPIFHVGTRYVVVVKTAGAADRYLRLSAIEGELARATAGNTFGHAAAENAVGVGGVDVRTAGGAGAFDGTESVETYSADGPRRIFFRPDGTALTPDDFSATGGSALQKPDLAAATCVSTATPFYSRFCGTSAAAPHAAAIAALLLEAAGGPANVSLAALRATMKGSSLDIEAAGVDRDSGAGIVMAPGAVSAAVVPVGDRNGAPEVTHALLDRTFVQRDPAARIDLTIAFNDPDDDTLTYAVHSENPDALAISRTGSQVELTPLAPGRAVVTVRATDPGGLSATQVFTVTVTAGDRDYDGDDDRLIDVASLAQLDAVRYDLDGDGVVDGAHWQPYYAAFVEGAPDMGCPGRCLGYELTFDLDFDTNGSGGADPGDEYWRGGAGWEPIGSSWTAAFSAVFDGNEHAIANLFIDAGTRSLVGLFGYVGRSAIRRVGLRDVQVTGNRAGGLIGYNDSGKVTRSHATGRVTGRSSVGGLVGLNRGNVSSSYASGHVEGVGDGVGGLVGDNEGAVTASYATARVTGRRDVGGLVGFNGGSLGASYAAGHVVGDIRVGGLVGTNYGNIDAAYATGSVSGERRAGGLVGFNFRNRRIRASYATGLVPGTGPATDGLVGEAVFPSDIQDSYWDTRTSGRETGSYGQGRTTAQLQEPTGYIGIYAQWSVDLDGDSPWHFGTDAEYPVLAVDVDGTGDATWQEFGYQLRVGPTLTATGTVGRSEVALSWTAADASHWTPEPDITYTVTQDDGTTVTVVADEISGTTATDTTVVSGRTYVYQVTAAAGGAAAHSERKSVTVGNRPPTATGMLANLTLPVWGVPVGVPVGDAFSDADNDVLTYGASSSAVSVASVTVSASTVSVTPLSGGTATITVTATDRAGSNTSATQTFVVTVANRSPLPVGTLPGLALTVAAGPATVEVSGAFVDPDGDALTYGVTSWAVTVAAVVLSGSTVSVTPLSGGTATITVTATDVGGSNTLATQGFGVSVDGGDGGGGGGGGGGLRNRGPQAAGTLDDRTLEVGASPLTVDVAAAFRDRDGDILTYGVESSSREVATVAVSGSMVMVTPLSAGEAVVTVTATDAEGSTRSAEQRFTVTVNYDGDRDGLIGVHTLAQLDAVRHDLDGDGVPTAAGAAAHGAAFGTTDAEAVSCGWSAGCGGYELGSDLNFDTNGSGGPDAGDAYWYGGAGWLPLGMATAPFTATFEGNGRRIRGLFVRRGDGAGLFGATGTSSVIRHLGLSGVDVTGANGVGALVAINGGLVTGSYATGRVAGGDVVGGLVGANTGSIGANYAAVQVSGETRVGGLVGFNDGRLKAGYATGRVSGSRRVGGLVGYNRGVLTAGYVTGRVSGTGRGRLVGTTEPPGRVTASYWDTDTSGLSGGPAGRGQPTSALQAPTDYAGLYAAWNVDVDGDGVADAPWHFGTTAQYPALSLDADADGRSTWEKMGRQLRAGPTVAATPGVDPAQVVLAWTAADATAWSPAPQVSYTVYRESGARMETVAAGIRGLRYADRRVELGGTYAYQVAAAVHGGEAVRSALVPVQVPCGFTVTPSHRDVLWTAGTGQVTVTTGPNCAWTATSESAFLTVTVGSAGVGPGAVTYTVSPNGDEPRTGVLLVAGQRITMYQASPTRFTDHPIQRGMTPVKTIHFLELRARIDAVRTGAGLPAFGWTNPTLTPGVTRVRRVHLTELRAALGEAYAAKGRSTPAYTDIAATVGTTVVKAMHLMELRGAVVGLEGGWTRTATPRAGR